MALWGSKGADANANELYALARQAGFSAQDAVTATAIALAETHGSGTTNSYNPLGADDSYGPWQINRRVGPKDASGAYTITDARGTPDELVNPQLNAAEAFALFQARGGWGDWSTFNDGSYQSYLRYARPAAADVPNDQIDSIVKELMNRVGIAATSTAAGTDAAPGQPGLPSGQADPGPAGPINTTGLSIPNPFDSVGAALGNIARPFVWLTVPGHWWAIAFILAGLALAVSGLGLYFKDEIGTAAAGVAKVAAVAA